MSDGADLFEELQAELEDSRRNLSDIIRDAVEDRRNASFSRSAPSVRRRDFRVPRPNVSSVGPTERGLWTMVQAIVLSGHRPLAAYGD
jgi:hypothetical protein